MRAKLLTMLLCLSSVVHAAGSAPQSGLDQWSARHLGHGWKVIVSDWLRYEDWRHFDPAGNVGDPGYGYLFNRLRLGVSGGAASWIFNASAQAVHQVSLPDDAVGMPGGPLGLGAVYYVHNQSRNPESIYLKALNAGVRDVFGSGLDISAGRMDYSSGMEAAAADPVVAAVKDMRIDSRLIGPFDWSTYQRAFDGIRVAREFETGRFDFGAFHPTQGGFEHDANRSIADIDVVTLTWTMPVRFLADAAELQLFGYLFEDTRRIPVRPDNTGLAVSRQAIDIFNIGGHLVATHNVSDGVADLLLWGVWQGGDWFGQDQDAYGVAAEVGFQWPRVPGRPWLRVGFYRGSGDTDPGDDEHGTLYQMLPTVRKYSFTTTYNLMNNTDLFVQLLLKPIDRLQLRADLHALKLSESEDLWWQGAGATQASGRIQGFSGRPSGGDRALGYSLEMSASYRLTPFAGIQLFYSRIEGRSVVEGLFAEDDDFHLFFAELNLRF